MEKIKIKTTGISSIEYFNKYFIFLADVNLAAECL